MGTVKAKQTHRQLTLVEARLETALASFVQLRLGGGPRAHDVCLAEAAELLEDLYLRWQRQPPAGRRPESVLAAEDGPDRRLLAALHGLEARAAQLENLNEAAIRFCRGWFSTAPPPVEEYSPEGLGARVGAPGAPQNAAYLRS